MAGHTAAYDAFIFSFNGGLAFKDDLDLDAYGRATAAEQGELDRVLEQKLPEGDPRVARAVAALWPADKAAASLTQSLTLASTEGRIGIVRALGSLSEQSSLDALRTALFDDAAADDARVAAAETIAEMDGAPASFSLKAALDEPLPVLRKRAGELLFRRSGLERIAADRNSGAALLGRLLQDADEGIRAQAIQELKRVIECGSAELAGYGGGATPAQLEAITAR